MAHKKAQQNPSRKSDWSDVPIDLAIGAGRGAAGLLDMGISGLSYPFRKMYNNVTDPRTIIQQNSDAMGDGNFVKQMGLLGLNQVKDVFGGISPVTNYATEMGLLNAPKDKLGEYMQSIGEVAPGVMTGTAWKTGAQAIPGAIRKILTTIGAGVGAQAGGDAAKQIDPAWEPYGRGVGGIAGGLPFIVTNRGQQAPWFSRDIKPNLTDEEIGSVKYLAGQKKYAPYFSGKIKESDAKLLQDIKDNIKTAASTKVEADSAVRSLLEGKQVDTSGVVGWLKSHLSELEGSKPGTGGEAAAYTRQMIADLDGQTSPYALHRAKQNIGTYLKDPNASATIKEGTARGLYGKVSEAIEEAAPGYKDIMKSNNASRQAALLQSELDSAEALSKGDASEALKKFSDRTLRHELKGEVDGISPEISNILDNTENYGQLYAERGGSGAKIAQRASQAAEGKKTGFFNLNKIADKFQDPVDDKAAFLRVTGPELPPPSHGMLTGLPEQRRQPFFLPNNGAYQTTKAASLTNAAAGLPSPRSGGGEYSGTQQQMMPQDQQNLDFSAPQLPETSYEDFQKTSDDLAAQRAQKQQQTSFADFESISNEMAARRKR